MRIRIGTLLTFILLLAVSVNAQTGGKIEVIESPKVKELVNSSNEVSQSMKYNMFGRIQYSGTKCPSC